MEAVALLAVHEAVVAHASIDKPALAASRFSHTAPHFWALQFLAEKLDAYLCTHPDPMRSRALLVADETNEHQAFAIQMVAGMQRTGDGVVSGRRLSRVIDSAHFVRSQDNRGVQVADLVAYALARSARLGPEPSGVGNLAIRAIARESIGPLIRTYRSRWPTTRRAAR